MYTFFFTLKISTVQSFRTFLIFDSGHSFFCSSKDSNCISLHSLFPPHCFNGIFAPLMKNRVGTLEGYEKRLGTVSISTVKYCSWRLTDSETRVKSAERKKNTKIRAILFLSKNKPGVLVSPIDEMYFSGCRRAAVATVQRRTTPSQASVDHLTFSYCYKGSTLKLQPKSILHCPPCCISSPTPARYDTCHFSFTNIFTDSLYIANPKEMEPLVKGNLPQREELFPKTGNPSDSDTIFVNILYWNDVYIRGEIATTIPKRKLHFSNMCIKISTRYHSFVHKLQVVHDCGNFGKIKLNQKKYKIKRCLKRAIMQQSLFVRYHDNIPFQTCSNSFSCEIGTTFSIYFVCYKLLPQFFLGISSPIYSHSATQTNAIFLWFEITTKSYGFWFLLMYYSAPVISLFICLLMLKQLYPIWFHGITNLQDCVTPSCHIILILIIITKAYYIQGCQAVI